MCLSVLLVVVSAMRLCCTFLCVPPHTLLPFLLLCFVFQQAHTTHTQDAHCSGFGCFFCSACWQLRVAVVFFRGHEEGGEGVRSPSLFSCGCDAPRVTALSWAPCPTDGGMAGNFVAASWMDEGALSRVAVVVGARAAATRPCALRLLGVLEIYLVMRTRWLCRWMCRVLRVTAA
ncbi:hypothetical protein TcCL_NonESM03976 [Trypanosoma cruzi]|nr:hypothetical protein TcCL_NonESM03976 [Trypanosoma cruzi]